MKKHIIIVLTAMVVTNGAYGQQAFSSAALTNDHQVASITFTVPSEANVFNYRIEASNDGSQFDVIGTVKPSGASMLSKKYCFQLYEPIWKYYRLDRVGMNGEQRYSELISATVPTLPPSPGNVRELPADSRALANGR